MFPLNEMCLIGKLGKDAETVQTPNGATIVTFSVATQEYMGRDESGKAKYDETEWTDVKCFGSLAEKVSDLSLKKGDQVFIIGRKKTETWDDKNGNKQYRVKCYAKDVGLIWQPDKQ